MVVVGIARTATTCATAEEGLDDGSIATADAGGAGDGSGGGGGGRADLGGGSLPRRPAGIRGGGLLTIDGLEGWRGSSIAGGPRGGGGRRGGLLLPSILPTTCCIGCLRSWSSGGRFGCVGIIGSARSSPTPAGGILDRWCSLARGGFPLATRRRGRLLSLS